MHFILATVGADGDVFPHVGLGRLLRARGRQVTPSRTARAAAKEQCQEPVRSTLDKAAPGSKMQGEGQDMSRPRREEFILDVRHSARTLQTPNGAADSDAVDTDAIAKILHRAALWLTPKVVEHYHPDDFAAWQAEQQNRLHLAVEEFRRVARQVPPDQPATVEQFKEGAELFRELVKVLGGMLLVEWLDAIDRVEKQAEEWSAEAAWRFRRVKKKMSESLLGAYEATQLLIFAEPHLYVLDPIARFVPGAGGF